LLEELNADSEVRLGGVIRCLNPRETWFGHGYARTVRGKLFSEASCQVSRC